MPIPRTTEPQPPTDATSWLAGVTEVVTRSGGRLGTLWLLVSLPTTVLVVLFGHAVGGRRPGLGLLAAGLVYLVVGLALALLAALASVWVIGHDADDAETTLPEALAFGVRRLPALAGWGCVAALLWALGTVALVLPGLYVAVLLGPLLLSVVAIEGRGVSRCLELARGRFATLLGRCLLGVLGAALYLLLAVAVRAVLVRAETPAWAAEGLNTILLVPLSVLAVAVGVVTYAELRGTSTATLRAALAER